MKGIWSLVFWKRLVVLTGLFLGSLGLVCLSFPIEGGGYAFLAWVAFIPLFALLLQIKTPLLKLAVSCLFSQLFFLLTFKVNIFNIETSFYQPGNFWGTLFLLLLIPVVYGITIFLISLFFGNPLLQAAVWAFSELVVFQNLLTFPMTLAITQFNNPYLLQLSSITGIYGIAFLIILFNSSLFHVFSCRRKSRFAYLGVALFLLCIALFHGWFRINHFNPGFGIKYNVALVQPNHSWMFGALAQQNPFIKKQYLADYFALSQKARDLYQPDLLVWPEGALKTVCDAEILDSFNRWGVDIIYGGFSVDAESGKPQNSILLYSPKTHISAVYAKEKLAPLFETFAYAPGKQNHPFYLEDKGVAIGPLICFESLFPGLARKQVSMGSNLLLCLSNDSFFRGPNLVILHAIYAVFRAAEFARPVVFINNNGLSVVSDHLGRICLVSPFDQANVSSTIIHPSNATTFYFLFPHTMLLATLSIILFSRGKGGLQ